jgi:hypothetical protein
VKSLDLRRAKLLILKYEAGFLSAGEGTIPGAVTLGFGFDLGRPDAPERHAGLGLDHERVLSGEQSLSVTQINQLFDADLCSAVEFAQHRVPGFDRLAPDRQCRILALAVRWGPDVLGWVLEESEKRRGSTDAGERAYSGWFDEVGVAPPIAIPRSAAAGTNSDGRRLTEASLELGTWAQRIFQAKRVAKRRYESGAGDVFSQLPTEIQDLLVVLARDHGSEGATRVWNAVIDHRWESALQELRELRGGQSIESDTQVALLRQALGRGLQSASPTTKPARRSTGDDAPVIVNVSNVGRLGNRLVLFTHLIAAAIEHGFVVVNPAFGDWSHLFPRTASDLLCRFPPCPGLAVPAGGRAALFKAAQAAADELHRLQSEGQSVGLIRLSKEERVDLNGVTFLEMAAKHRVVITDGWNFRNNDNCLRHRNAICAFFTPSVRVLDRARAPVRRARETGSLVVGVHVRRDDYAGFRGGRFCYTHAEYHRMMSALQTGPDGRPVTFFVCSDEPVPTSAFPGLNVVVGSGDIVDDLYGLAACDFVLGPARSTFSRWAAYYGDVPIHQVEDPDAVLSYASFRAGKGLGWGAARRDWVDPALRNDGAGQALQTT